MSQELIAQRIAAKCYFTELAAASALGIQGVECYVSAFKAMDQTYARAFEPDRPAVYLPMRMITGRR